MLLNWRFFLNNRTEMLHILFVLLVPETYVSLINVRIHHRIYTERESFGKIIMMLRKCSKDHSRKKKKEKVGDRVSNPVGFPKK